jgi:hypothetical protein
MCSYRLNAPLTKEEHKNAKQVGDGAAAEALAQAARRALRRLVKEVHPVE